MRNPRFPAAVTAAVITCAATVSAQICPAPSLPGEFVKTVCVIAPTTDACDPTRIPPLAVYPGEILQYEVLRCNISGGIPCESTILDDLDALLPGRESRLTFIPNPTTACGSPLDLGGAVCEFGPVGGPWTPLASPEIVRCGQDCTTPTDGLALQPGGSPPTLLNPDSCYRMTFRAVVGAIPDTECLCNQAQTIIDLAGTTANSNDPNWTSIEISPTEVGCSDLDTCPLPGACTTCVKVPAIVDLSTSLKCIDVTTPACGDLIFKAAGDPITYHFSVCNTGTIATSDVRIDDPLDFISTTSQPCLNLTAGVSIVNVSCSWLGGPCGPPDATILWDGTSRVTGTVPSLPPGACVTWEARATVATGFTGQCANVWDLSYGPVGSPPVPVNRPAFRSNGALPLGSKCVDDGFGACNPTPPARREGDPVSYIVEFTNVGDAQSRDAVIEDVVPSCLTVDPASIRCVIGACGGGVTCTPTFVGPDRVEAAINRFRVGCTIQVFYDTVVAVGASTPCCNNAQAVWTDPPPGGTATTTDVCFEVGDVVDLRASSKCIDDGLGRCEVGVTHDPPDVLRYRVRLQNNGSVDAQDLTMTDLLPACLEGVAGGETCIADAGCAALCTVSVRTTDVSGTADLLATGCGVTYEFDARVIDDGSRRCCNQADAAWRLPSPGAVGPLETCFDRTPLLEVAKLVDGASVASVAPGGQKTFTITVTNNATSTVSCTLDDDVAATTCMTLDGTTPCTSIPDIGLALDCGLTVANLVTATFDVPASASQVVTVPVTAGAILGLCGNTVNVVCSGTATDSTASLNITDVGCDLAKVVDSPPVVRAPPWVYVNPCGVGDDRIDNTIIITSGIPGAPLSLTDSADPGTDGELTLYQLDCGCTGTLLVFKSALVGGVIRVRF